MDESVFLHFIMCTIHLCKYILLVFFLFFLYISYTFIYKTWKSYNIMETFYFNKKESC